MSTSPASIQRHLRGASYPAELDELIAQAEQNDAPAGVIEAIETLEERVYESPADLSQAISADDDE